MRNKIIVRPLLWGLIVSIIGLAGWFLFVILSVITGGAFRVLANIFGRIMLFGLPAGIIWEIVRRI
ncbi:MAG: hypothetical protein G01um101444_470, partial [Parcubacteria group bacterium Gr01-1014_44]